ncbi:hypothetical protein BpHYR1_025194 [Brachionus plicatilis]|uniref:Uncharacterized protein n=1 Tax=Brachionus plicatilis TaxID=10195 RepID=A0A3M7SV47_BRAPC|nr:hypothetical protein BpHYR1_025194 [Brachionus plicatilis]
MKEYSLENFNSSYESLKNNFLNKINENKKARLPRQDLAQAPRPKTYTSPGLIKIRTENTTCAVCHHYPKLSFFGMNLLLSKLFQINKKRDE